jgi:hypothetical protein
VLRGLSTGFSVFSVLVNIDIGSIAVQTHAAKLHSRTINGVVSRHDYSFLLFHDTTLRSGGPSAGLEYTRREGSLSSMTSGGRDSRDAVGIKGAAHCASRSGCGSGR